MEATLLQPADHALLDRDRSLLGLQLALDPVALTTRLCELLPEADVRGVAIDYLRYKPNTNCVARLRVESSSGSVDGYLKAFHRGDDGKLSGARGRVRRSGRSPLGPGRLMLDAWASAVVFLPHDDQLKALERLAEPGRWSRLLARLELPEAFNPAQLEMLSYKPERRYVARLTAPDGQQALLKLMRRSAHERARNGARAAGALAVPSPCLLGASSRHGALALNWLEGQPLAALLADATFEKWLIDELGVTLARLHAADVRGPLRAACEGIPSLSALAADLTAVQPQLASLAREVAERLPDRLGDTDAAERLIHGDCHLGQFLVTKQGIAVLDFDRAALGPPYADIGQLIAQLEWEVLQGALSRPHAIALREGFLAGYARHQPIVARQLEAHIAHALLRLAPQPFRMRTPQWPSDTVALLKRSIAWLDGAGERWDAAWEGAAA